MRYYLVFSFSRKIGLKNIATFAHATTTRAYLRKRIVCAIQDSPYILFTSYTLLVICDSNAISWWRDASLHGHWNWLFRTTSTSSPQAKSPAGSSAGAAGTATTSTAPGDRTPTAHNKQLQNVKGQDHPAHPSVSLK